MLQLAGKADETSKSTGFTVWSRLCVQRACKGSGADPGTRITHHCRVTLTKQNRCTTSCGFLLVFDAFSALFMQLFSLETEQLFTSNPLLFPRSGHVSQP